jgi:uncharacterized repeat protein (TIGR04076 family)
MKSVRITVLKTMINQELIQEYGAENLTMCPYHKVGDVFLSEGGGKPEGLCEEAWAAFGKYAFALASGGEGFWPEWIEKRHISINSCCDGLRPVIFKLEVIES